MSERDGRYSRNDLPSTTAEFRATPDASASTAQFRAFATGQDVGASRARGDTDGWPEQPWAGEAPAAQGAGRTTAIVVGAIVVLALLITLIVLLA